MQHWHKGQRPETSATRQNENKESRRHMAAIFEEGEDNLEGHQMMQLRTAITSQKKWNSRGTLYEISRLKTAKQMDETSSGL
jgi:hypothetical protein